MDPFTRLTSNAAVLLEDNIDTDIIFPARFLLITARDGLGRYAFHDRRFHPDGSEQSDFILNRDIFKDAGILMAGANFGSGSSREQAVWSLLDRGIRCIIAPSFGEIFYGNCFRNGVVPVILPRNVITALSADAMNQAMITVDLENLTVTSDRGQSVDFFVADDKRQAMLNGWDETDIILNTHGDALDMFEQKQRNKQPWLYQRAV